MQTGETFDNSPSPAEALELTSLPTVILPESVEAVREAVLRDDWDDETRVAFESLVGSYYVTDEKAAVNLRRLLDYLFAGGSHGAAVLINGVYGTGKTHLLALLGLLCESPAARETFVRQFPECRELLTAEGVARPASFYVSLEAFSGKTHALEDVLWKETRRQLAARGCEWDAPAVSSTSRDEVLRSLLRCLADKGFDGCAWLVDELSLFLGAKEAPGLANDAAFLQFLSQRAARHRLRLIASVQRSLAHLGEVDTHSLRQLHDRLAPPVTLTLTHVGRVLRERLLPVREEETFSAFTQQLLDHLRQRFPHLDWDLSTLRACYPFHPETLACLERVAARFFSRTRSALGFLQVEAQRFLSCPDPVPTCGGLITPDRLFDYFEADLEGHPELNQYATLAWQHFRANLPSLLDRDHEFGARLVKLLIVEKIGGKHPTVREIANHLLFDSGLPGEGSYGYAQAVLETLRTGGDYLTTQRHEELFADRYTIDLGARLATELRRRLANAVYLLQPADARAARAGFAACDDADWPLARVVDGGAFTARWRHDRRTVACQLTMPEDLSPERLATALARTANPAASEVIHLHVANPLAVVECREAWTMALAELPDDRRCAGLVLWLPREPTTAERHRLRELGAAELLQQDPTLRDNPRGRQLLQMLGEELPAMRAGARHLLWQIFVEGLFVDGHGSETPVTHGPGELPAWRTCLSRLLARQLPLLFPRCPELPPLLATGLADASQTLTNARLRGQTVPAGSRAADFEGYLANFEAALRDDILARIPEPPGEGASLRERYVACESLLASLAKGEWGATAVLTEPVLAQLLATGELQGLDGDFAPLAASRLAAPLPLQVHGLVRGQLLPPEQWNRLRPVAAALCAIDLPPIANYPAQQQAWRALTAWRTESLSRLERAQARLNQVIRALGQSPADWRQAADNFETTRLLVTTIDPARPARQGLEAVAQAAAEALHSAPADELAATIQQWEATAAFLLDHGNEVLLAHAYLTEPGLRPPPGPLQKRREQLLLDLRQGEGLQAVADEVLCRWRSWQQEYIDLYLRWHAKSHAADRFRPLANLRRGPTAKALERLQLLGLPLPAEASQSLQRLSRELGKCCAQPGLEHLLQAFPHCTHCGLRGGEKLELPSADALAHELTQALRASLVAVLTDDRRAAWRQAAAAQGGPAGRRLQALCELDLAEVDPESLCENLGDEVFALIHAGEAASPRSLTALREVLLGRSMPLGEARRVVGSWLNPQGKLSDTDLVSFQE